MRRLPTTAVPLTRGLDRVRSVEGHDFSRADKANRMKGALAPEVCFRSIRKNIGHFFVTLFACILICLLAPVYVSSQSSPLIDTGHVTVDGRDVPYRIRNLPINAFPELPAPIIETLTNRGCVIPQTYQAKRPENVIHASLEHPGSQDWAVLCSTQGNVSLLVFLASTSASKPAVLASVAKTARLQAHDSSGELGFNWGIDPATPRQVHDAEAGLAHRPSPPDHDCLADTVIDRKTVYHLYQDGSWSNVEIH